MNSPHADNHSREELAPESVPTCIWKRTLDIGLILLALPFLIPIILVIAVLIWIVSPGPVLFRQERLGYRGRRFMCFKFRTMAVGADPDMHKGHLENLLGSNAPMEKIDAQGDPRVIPFGAILRSSGLDELPQVINVLLGDMSLVGPRPCLPYEYEKYLSWQRERFNAVPGLTGLWQVSGKNRTTFIEMVLLDITYARSQTLWLDLKIIFKTIPALLVQMRDDLTRKRSLSASPRPKAGFLASSTSRYTIRETRTITSGNSFQHGCLTRK